MVRTCSPVALLLLCLGCGHVVQASGPGYNLGIYEASFYDITRRALSGSKTRAVSLGMPSAHHNPHGAPVVATCLKQTQWKKCRATGSMASDDSAVLSPPVVVPANDTATSTLPPGFNRGTPSGIYFQTDFDCCDQPRARDLHSTAAAKTHKVAGCEWEFNLYKETDAVTQGGPSDGDLFPVEEDGPYLKLGTAWGRCIFNKDSEACGPHREDMTVTMQGGIYITLAYSHEEGDYLESPPGDNCINTHLFNSINNQFGDNKTDASKQPRERNVTINASSAVAHTWAAILAKTVSSDLYKRAEREIGPMGAASGNSTAQRKTGLQDVGSGATGAQAPGSGLYGGMALVLMGETVVSSMSGSMRVERTGHMEYCAQFLAWATGLADEFDYPFVRGGAMKLSFQEKGRNANY